MFQCLLLPVNRLGRNYTACPYLFTLSIAASAASTRAWKGGGAPNHTRSTAAPRTTFAVHATRISSVSSPSSTSRLRRAIRRGAHPNAKVGVHHPDLRPRASCCSTNRGSSPGDKAGTKGRDASAGRSARSTSGGEVGQQRDGVNNASASHSAKATARLLPNSQVVPSLSVAVALTK